MHLLWYILGTLSSKLINLIPVFDRYGHSFSHLSRCYLIERREQQRCFETLLPKPIDSIDLISKIPTKLHSFPIFKLKLSNRSTDWDDKIAIQLSSAQRLGFQALDRDICIAISTTSRLKSIESRPPLHRLIPNEALFFRAAFFRLGCVNAKDSTTMLPPPPPPTFHRSYRISSREQDGQLSLTRPTTNTRGLDNEPCPCPVPRTFLTDLCVKIGGRLTLRNVEIARKETGERNEVETNYRGDETTGGFRKWQSVWGLSLVLDQIRGRRGGWLKHSRGKSRISKSRFARCWYRNVWRLLEKVVKLFGWSMIQGDSFVENWNEVFF